MKKITFLLFVSTLLIFVACKKEVDLPLEEEVIECIDECLFVVKNEPGTMIYMSCFGKWGIRCEDPDSAEPFMYGIPDEVAEAFQEEEKEVTFTAKYRENELPLQFPDPTIGDAAIYQIELISIK